MKKNDTVIKLDFSDEFFMESAEKRYESGDYLGALTMLNKRAGMYEPSADASALYGDIYEALELYSLCADSWFRFLDTCNEADFIEGYEGLAVAFMNMGDDFQSELYYRRAYNVENLSDWVYPEAEKPKLRIVYSADGAIGNPDLIQTGLMYLRTGELDKARDALAEIPPESIDYASASGLTALCMLLSGDTEGAAAECRKLLETKPDDVSALTTYCAVLGAQGDTEGAKAVGRRLAILQPESVEDLFRVATALCETGLDEEAYEKLTLLKEKLAYNDDVLWFHAVAACKTGRIEEAIFSLERLTTVYPRKAVAKFYLERLRGETGEMPASYFYRLPDEEYKTIANFLLTANATRYEAAEQYADIPEIEDYLRLAFDNLDGRDEKMQALASKVAIRCRCDYVVRDVLLDYTANDLIKFSMLHDLVLRNEENSFGVVVCNLYREFFTHKIEIGSHKNKQFMNAFAEVYSKYALIGEEHEEKLVITAEEVYRLLEEAGATDFFEEQEALSAVIFREARLKRTERSIDKIAALFGANVKIVKEILNYLI